MAESQFNEDLVQDLERLLGELHGILSENKSQLEQASIRADLVRLLAWAESAYSGSVRAERLLETRGPELVGHMQNWIELAGREYMDLEGESPTVAPEGEPDPQKLFETAGKLGEVMQTLSHLKKQAEQSSL